MPSLLSRLNCFSKKKDQERRRDDGNYGGDDAHKRLLVSPSGTNSTSSSPMGTTSNSPTSKKGSKQSKPLSLNHRKSPVHDEDDSLPTMDSDYNNMKSSNFSLSDAGGTIGTQNQSLTNFSHAQSAFGSMAPSAFGTSSMADSLERKLYSDYPSNLIQSPVQARREEMLEINAPRGKLGLVIDTPADAMTPVVHAIKDTCPIGNQIYVGDKLVAVDDVDVREMSAVEVSRLISKKSGQATRKLTIIRSARGRGGMY